MPLGEQHLRTVVREYVAHYHAERNRQALGNVIPIPDAKTVNKDGKVARRQRLGGILNYDHREAA